MMDDMDDMVQWLSARAATDGPWRVNDESYAESIYSADGTAVVAGGRWGGEASVFEDTADAIHIAAHDPSWRLTDIARKRKILADHSLWMGWSGKHPTCARCYDGDDVYAEESEYPCLTVRLLAEEFASELGYREEWRP